MVQNLANQCEFALIAAATDVCLRARRDPHSTPHVARRTNPIPFSPANGITLRIFEGNLPLTTQQENSHEHSQV